ncbi:hypothetical protein C0J52_23749 [Blattella germanica]|nr:hypothetical protein C0J52_23749 [Blattella germanica]
MKCEKKLLKILCLHGYRQSGDIFKQKLGGFRKALKRHAELIFITAPNQLPPAEEASESEQYGWWFSTENLTFDSKVPSDLSLGFQKSLELIEKTFQEQGPFDGILGFSQGAAFVGILCGMQEHHMLKYEFRFAILVAGFKSLCMPHMNYYLKVCSLPSLHVYGETDQIITRERSELLQEQFEDPDVIIHPGRHFVPASNTEKQGYILFLEQIMKEIQDEEEIKKKQIQIGSFVLERVDDSESDEGNDKRARENGSSSAKHKKTRRRLSSTRVSK